MVDLENSHSACRASGRVGAAHTASPRMTAQRAEVLRALSTCEGFVSAQTLHALMVAQGSTVGLTTVYRTLAMLVDAGSADLVRETNGERRYRHQPGRQHRHYLICRRCGHSEPVDTTLVEDWARRLARDTGYADLHHTLELAGICGPCHAAADN